MDQEILLERNCSYPKHIEYTCSLAQDNTQYLQRKDDTYSRGVCHSKATVWEIIKPESLCQGHPVNGKLWWFEMILRLVFPNLLSSTSHCLSYLSPYSSFPIVLLFHLSPLYSYSSLSQSSNSLKHHCLSFIAFAGLV